MLYSDVVATIAMIVSVVAVPASGFISYKVAVKGEKLKEWNALAEPVYDFFFEQYREDGVFNLRQEVPFKEINALRKRFSRKESKIFESNFVKYIYIRNQFTRNKPLTERTKINLYLAAKELSLNITKIIKVK